MGQLERFHGGWGTSGLRDRGEIITKKSNFMKFATKKEIPDLKRLPLRQGGKEVEKSREKEGPLFSSEH